MLPSFEDQYEKLQQLLKLCNTIWPGTMKLWKHPSNGNLHQIVNIFLILLPLQTKYIPNFNSSLQMIMISLWLLYPVFQNLRDSL